MCSVCVHPNASSMVLEIRLSGKAVSCIMDCVAHCFRNVCFEMKFCWSEILHLIDSGLTAKRIHLMIYIGNKERKRYEDASVACEFFSAVSFA